MKLYGEPRRVHTAKVSSNNQKGMQSIWNNGNITEKGHSRWTEIKAKGCREGKTTGSTEAGTNEACMRRKRTEVRKDEGQ